MSSQPIFRCAKCHEDCNEDDVLCKCCKNRGGPMKTYTELESWVNREINYCLENPRQRYEKARDEGYVLALKKVQARMQEVERCQ